MSRRSTATGKETTIKNTAEDGIKNMRLWHKDLLPYLPDLQFRGQLRETIAIMRYWKNNGKTHHLLINKVMDGGRAELVSYFIDYTGVYAKRYGKDIYTKFIGEFLTFCPFYSYNPYYFTTWHNQEYLRVCMANLYEKYRFGMGKTKIKEDEWQILIEGYKKITGEDYKI